MQINAYLTFHDSCEEAFNFYQQCLGGELVAMHRFSEIPGGDQMPAEVQNRIMHARLAFGDQALMGSDSTPEHPYEGIKGCSVSLNVDTPEDAERIFGALSQGGAILMPLEPTFWAGRFGMVTDRFGVPWMVNCEHGAHAPAS